MNEGRPVAILSGTAPQEIANQALANGAAGFIPKTLRASSMVNAVRFMASGETYVPFSFMQQKPEDPSIKLSKREMQVLVGLCDGKSNKEIARDLGLVDATVKLHVKTLCRKLNARNRTQAAMIAKEHDLL